MNKIAAIAIIFALIFGVCSGYVWIVEAEGAFGFEGTQSGFKLIVDYEDGSSETFEHAVFSLLPYTITDNSGKPIERITIYFNSRLWTDGTVSGWSVSGSQQIEFYRGGENIPELSSTQEFDESGISWLSGDSKQVLVTPLHWSQIESAVKKYGAGSWSMQVLGQAQIDVIFSDDSSCKSKIASAPAVTLAFTYSGAPIYSIIGWTLSVQNDFSTLSFTSDFAASTGLPTWILHMIFPLLTAIFGAVALLTYREN